MTDTTPQWAKWLARVALLGASDMPPDAAVDMNPNEIRRAAKWIARDVPLLRLLDTHQEMTAACAAAMRVMVKHGLVNEFLAERNQAGVPDGFGLRAADALRDFMGGAT
jgi:hypothetical protein